MREREISHATCGRDQIMKLIYAKLRHVLVKLYCKMKGRMRQWNIPTRLIFQNPGVLSLELVPFIFVLTLFAFVISNVNHTEIMVHGCTSYHWVMDSCSFVRASCSYISARHLKTLRLPKHSLVLTLDVRESESN